jgi:hypothetical protein
MLATSTNAEDNEKGRTELQNEENQKAKLEKHTKLLWFVHKVQSYGFWALILLGSGIAVGILYADRESVKNINAQILVGSFLHKGVVYDVTPRAIQPAPLSNTDQPQPAATTKGGNLGSNKPASATPQ